MRTQGSKLIFILVVLIILPIVGYFVYELSQVNENEAFITSVYEEQLQSTLFSVNQYSNDFMNSLMERIELSYDPKTASISEEMTAQIYTNGYHQFYIIPFDKIDQQDFIQDRPSAHKVQIEQFLEENVKIIYQLLSYKEQGYRKIEPAGMLKDEEGTLYQVILTVMNANNTTYLFVGLIKPQAFVQEVLAPKMQQIARSKLILMMNRADTNELLYETEPLTTDLIVSTKLWLFPDYTIGVSPKNVTLHKLVYDRLSTNLLALALLITMMSIGAFLIFRNIQKEQQLNQAKSDFISNVSHELRTPLALIKMFAETLLLKRASSQAKQDEYLEIIYKETNRLTNIVNRILNFSRIEANRRIYHKSIMSLNELVEEISRDYSYHLESNGFELAVRIEQRDINTLADREAIYEALIILIDNAMKYSAESFKKIELLLTATIKEAKLSVIDHGMGIAADRLPHIFEKFYRVSDNDRYVAQGAGLGLSILKHIMDAHEADIQVTSKPGEGSTFTLVLKRH